jgi:hypothetical protein
MMSARNIIFAFSYSGSGTAGLVLSTALAAVVRRALAFGIDR